MKNLKKMRLARNLSQQKLANHLGLSQQSIYKYENDLSEPDIQTLKNFAAFFHTTIDTLVDYTPDTQSSGQAVLSPDDGHLLYLYHCLSEEEQRHILAILEALAD